MTDALSPGSDYPCLFQSTYFNQVSLGLLSNQTVTEMTVTILNIWRPLCSMTCLKPFNFKPLNL